VVQVIGLLGPVFPHLAGYCDVVLVFKAANVIRDRAALEAWRRDFGCCLWLDDYVRQFTKGEKS